MIGRYQPIPPKGAHPYIFAHRGISARAPENTLASFQRAFEINGINGVELDVRLSQDEEVIVLHDLRLERTSTGNGIARKYKTSELKTFDAGSWFSTQYSGEKIPTLREVFQLLQGERWVNIEMKSEFLHREPRGLLERRVVETVRACGYEDKVLYSSFYYPLLVRIKEIEPAANTGVLYNLYRDFYRLPSQLARSSESNVFVCAKHELRRRMLDDAHEHNIAVYVYTLNDFNSAKQMIDIGVDGILSDDAEEIVKLEI